MSNENVKPKSKHKTSFSLVWDNL